MLRKIQRRGANRELFYMYLSCNKKRREMGVDTEGDNWIFKRSRRIEGGTIGEEIGGENWIFK